MIISLLCFIFLGFACTSSGKMTGGASAGEIDAAIKNRHWIFTAQQANGDAGTTRQLNSNYDVTLKNDTMVSALPYFGRAYSGAGLETKSVLDFKSLDFKLSEEVNNKGATIITIRPNDYSDVQSYTFTFFNNGRADLIVALTSRTPINFSGNVRPVVK